MQLLKQTIDENSFLFCDYLNIHNSAINFLMIL